MSSQLKPDNQYYPLIATTAGILFVSTASIFIRFAQAEASSIVIAASRLVIASLVLIPIAVIKYRNQMWNLSRRDAVKALLSGLFLALHFASWISSLEFTSVASSVVLVTTTPLWVAIFSPLVLKEHIRRAVLLGVAVSIMGGVIVGMAHACDLSEGGFICHFSVFGGQVLMGNFLALLGAWMAAGYLLMGRQLRKSLAIVPYTALIYGIAALILIAAVLVRKEPVFFYSDRIYLWLIALGIFPQLLGHTLFNWSLKYISAAYVSLTLLGEPIGTIVLAYVFLQESPTLLEGVGSILILAGIVIASAGKLRRSSEA